MTAHLHIRTVVRIKQVAPHKYSAYPLTLSNCQISMRFTTSIIIQSIDKNIFYARYLIKNWNPRTLPMKV